MAIGAAIFLSFVVLGITAPVIAPADPTAMNLSIALQPSSAEHPLGTDELGRDLLSRVLVGTRISLVLGVGATIVAGIIGTLVGLAAGYYGGRLGSLLMRITDLLLVFPAILLAILLLAIVGSGIGNLLIAIGIAATPSYARLVRASTLAIVTQEFVTAARAIGAGDLRIMLLHVLPNAVPTIIVNSTFLIPRAIRDASTLSFLGIGIAPPTPEWGAMLATGKNYLQNAPHLSLAPGLALLVVVVGINLFGDGLRDLLDPRTLSRLTSKR
jgi:peptide/nickel transport system permease protein